MKPYLIPIGKSKMKTQSAKYEYDNKKHIQFQIKNVRVVTEIKIAIFFQAMMSCNHYNRRKFINEL